MSNESKPTVDGFPQRLRFLRLQKGLSQRDLAKAAGVHYTRISGYERGTTQPTAGSLHQLAAALSVSTSYLLEGVADNRVGLEDRELLETFQAIEKFPEEDKLVIRRVLRAFLTERRVRELAAG